MKTIKTSPASVSPASSSRQPSTGEDRGARLAFYFFMGMLAVALIYFLLLPFFI
ncbi:hypothetical protein GQ464_018100 [Rhodocaloribacter litoris]|uniref:hypothetical protein n=1 Tax=Rhodocaloribacter litoris TaxID=2558931 RepID=UPI0014222110|nr:hypothetical protein [Rhodocaloribacter litoris]QXD15282.1 hypothetical protein GQ464_018100 [Rhodocaloribacter litoris]GIV62283.1 MAG: hypothetical protein KatS3mg044_1149 [Rhodothermaceae bacterium]